MRFMTFFARVCAWVVTIFGGNPRRFICPHGSVTYCNACVREDIIAKLGHLPEGYKD